MSGSTDRESKLALLRANLEACRAEIAAAAERGGRDPDAIELLPVTKYLSADVFALLHRLGLRSFGESRVQRVVALSEELAHLEGVEWHLVGHLQRNKAARALQLCSSIHSVDSLRLARELVSQATSRGLRLPALYVEVNVAKESQKTGLPEDDLTSILEFFREREGGTEPASGPDAPVKGLMTMAPYATDPESSRPYFRRLRELRDACVERGLLRSGSGLSMGMSGDFQVAIEEGATVVRIGTRLYEGLLPEEG